MGSIYYTYYYLGIRVIEVACHGSCGNAVNWSCGKVVFGTTDNLNHFKIFLAIPIATTTTMIVICHVIVVQLTKFIINAHLI